MFIYNVKVNGTKLFKIFFTIVCIAIVLLFGISVYTVFHGSIKVNDTIPPVEVNKLNNSNYTSVLKTVHENMDIYVGQKISFTGYIYRVYDLKDNQFVLARNMIISSDFQSVVVGFLCEYDQAKNFENDIWVEITGEIIKGDYHGAMPIIKIIDMKKTDKPQDEYVYPPDETYVPTSTIL